MLEVVINPIDLSEIITITLEVSIYRGRCTVSH